MNITDITQVEWHLKGEPRPVQLEATARSFYGTEFHTAHGQPLPYPLHPRRGTAKGWLHLLEMRLGKTPLTLNEMCLLREVHGVKHFIILSPMTYKSEWVNEASNFGVPFEFIPFETSRAKKTFASLDWNEDWALVMNYEAFIQPKVAQFLQQTFKGDHTAIIADESIKLKNNTGIISRNVRELAKDVRWRRGLTGLPFTQGPHELYPQFRFCGMQEGTRYHQFRNKFCKMGGFKRKKVMGTKNEEQLGKILDACSFTALRKYWGVVKDTEYQTEKITMAPAQQKHFNAVNDEFYTIFEDGSEVSAEQIITKLLKLQQITSGFVYTDEGKVVRISPEGKTPKLDRMQSIMEENTGKGIVFYHYNETGDILSEQLKAYNPAFIRSKEWMRRNEKDITEEKRKFNEDPKCRVIICSLEAVKYGNTLTGNDNDPCTYMAFFEDTYSLDTRTQCEMRPVKAVQDHAMLCFDFASSPIEAAVAEAQQKKMSLVQAVRTACGV